MYPQYNKETNISGQEIIWYEENGFRYSFVKDPANSDYQRYLRWLNGEEETLGGN